MDGVPQDLEAFKVRVMAKEVAQAENLCAVCF